MRPGMTICLTKFLPSIWGAIFSSASATSMICSWEASAATVMRLRTLPLIWTGSSTSSSVSHFSSKVGKG